MNVDTIVTTGEFRLDGEVHIVDNNVYVVGDEREVVVIDAAHDAAAILAAIGDRRVVAILLTHAHSDHVDAAPALAAATGAPILMHPADQVLWELTHPGASPDGELADGQRIDVAGSQLEVRHTPGHAPGAVCFYSPDLGMVFTGDTLFQGGPGATGRSHSHRPTLLASIADQLLDLPAETVVATGHGPTTTIGVESTSYAQWVAELEG